MGKGYLQVQLFAGDHAVAVPNANVLIKDTKGNILYNLYTDENGITDKVTLEAPNKNSSLDPYHNTPVFSICDAEVPMKNGYKRVIIHDVQIFDGETSILPIHMEPAISDGTNTENTEEIYIPYEHGVDINRRMPANDQQGNQLNIGADTPEEINMEQIMANEVQIPYYITVHLGMPNATAQNVRVPFIDYIKEI